MAHLPVLLIAIFFIWMAYDMEQALKDIKKRERDEWRDDTESFWDE